LWLLTSKLSGRPPLVNAATMLSGPLECHVRLQLHRQSGGTSVGGEPTHFHVTAPFRNTGSKMMSCPCFALRKAMVPSAATLRKFTPAIGSLVADEMREARVFGSLDSASATFSRKGRVATIVSLRLAREVKSPYEGTTIAARTPAQINPTTPRTKQRIVIPIFCNLTFTVRCARCSCARPSRLMGWTPPALCAASSCQAEAWACFSFNRDERSPR